MEAAIQQAMEDSGLMLGQRLHRHVAMGPKEGAVDDKVIVYLTLRQHQAVRRPPPWAPWPRGGAGASPA